MPYVIHNFISPFLVTISAMTAARSGGVVAGAPAGIRSKGGPSRFIKWLEAASQFSNEVLIEPDDEWLMIKTLDDYHISAVFTKLKLEEPLYDKFAVDIKRLLRFLKHVRGRITLSLEGEKLLIEGEGFTLRIDTLDPGRFRPIPEPNIKFDAEIDVEIALLSDALKDLRKVDVIAFIVDKVNGLRIEAKTETSQYSCWLGTPSFFYKEVAEVRANFSSYYLARIVNALKTLERPPNTTFATLKLKTNHPAKFTLKDDDLLFTAYIAPRLD
jgi:hypothetical protein